VAVANVVAKFEADISDVQAKMAALKKSFNGAADDAGRLGDRLKAVGTEMSRVGKGMTIGVTLPLAAVGAAAVKASVDFESSMSKIVGLVGIASDEVKAMQEDVLALSGETAKSPVELADALFVVTSAGLRGETAMAALRQSALAGAAGLGQTADIARSVAGALSAYGSDVLTAADATDQIVATARAGNFETSEFANAIGRVLPFAQQAGASFAEMGGAVALLTRVNGNAAQSVTQMAALFRAFVVPTEEAKKALADVGMSAQDLRDSISKDGLPATLQMLDKALGGNREQLGRLLGSSEAASAAFQILGADAQTLTDTFGVVADSAGMTQEAFDAAADTAGFKMQQAMASLQATLIGIGDIIVPLVTEFAKFAKVLLDGFAALPGPVKTLIVAFAGIVAALGPILWIGGKVLTMFGTMATAAATLRTKMATAFAGIKATLVKFQMDVKTAMIAAKTQMGAMAAAAKVAGIGIKAAFLSMASAVKGFMVSLGPVGWAIIGVSVAYEVLSGRSAEAEANVQALTDALSQQGEAATKAAAEIVAGALLANEWGRFLWIENNVQDFEQLADIAGVSMAEVVSAVMAGGEQLEAVIASFTEAGATGLIDPLRAAEAVAAIQAQADQYVEAGRKVQIADEAVAVSAQVTGEAQRSLTSATVAAAVAMGNAAGPTQEIADVTRATEAAVRALQTAFNDLNAVLSKSAAQDRMITSLQAMKDSFADNESSAMDNRDAIRAYMSDAMAFAKTLDDPRKQLKVMEGALQDVEKQMKAGEIDPKTSKLYKDMKGAVKAAKDEIKEMGDAVTAANEAGVDVADAIAQGIEQGMSQQEATINAAGMLGGEVLAEGINGALGISSPSRVAMQAGRNTGIGLIQGLNQMRSAASGAGMNVGANIVRGMLTALNNGEGPVAAAARRLVAAAIAAARAESQEGSPSKVFIRIGDNIGEGLRIGIARSGGKVSAAAAALVRALTRAFNDALAPSMGPVQSAFADVFASVLTVRDAERELQDATWGLADARDAVANAEKALAEARKEGKAREIAAAERDLARARRDLTDASKALGAAQKALDLAKYVTQNKQAVKALEQLGKAFDYIVAKMEEVSGALAELQDLTARPFGQASQVARMFGKEANIDSVISSYMQLRDVVTEAFGVLTDPKIVGRQAANANREQMNATLGQLESLTAEAVQLREQYQANLDKITQLEKDYQDEVAGINSRYDALEKAGRDNLASLEQRLSEVTAEYERENSALLSLVSARDQFLTRLSDSTRQFVNNLSFPPPTTRMVREARRLANGILVVMDREITEGGDSAGIRGALEQRLDAVRAFSANIRALVQRGLDPTLVQDFVSAGVSGAGDAVAELVKGTDEELRAINSLQSALGQEIADFGSYAEAQWYAAGIAQQEAVVAPLEAQKAALEQSVADAKAALDQLAKDRQAALDKAKTTFEAEKAKIEADNAALLVRMDQIAAQIETIIANLAATLPPRTVQAGQDAMQALLDGFRRKYPQVARDLGKLMDALAASLNRTITLTVRTVYEAAGSMPRRAMGGPVQARTAYLVGERGPEVFVPYGNGNIIPNHNLGSIPAMGARGMSGGAAVININVNAGMGADGAEIGRQVVDSLRQYERRNGPIPIKVAG
jgi:TP901 family phage tail tape measure protein